jgi:hypothetical protein
VLVEGTNGIRRSKSARVSACLPETVSKMVSLLAEWTGGGGKLGVTNMRSRQTTAPPVRVVEGDGLAQRMGWLLGPI